MPCQLVSTILGVDPTLVPPLLSDNLNQSAVIFGNLGTLLHP